MRQPIIVHTGPGFSDRDNHGVLEKEIRITITSHHSLYAGQYAELIVVRINVLYGKYETT